MVSRCLFSVAFSYSGYSRIAICIGQTAPTRHHWRR